jgi:hypothetical protein
MLTGLLLPSSPSKADWLNGSEKRWLATKVRMQSEGLQAMQPAAANWVACIASLIAISKVPYCYAGLMQCCT